MIKKILLSAIMLGILVTVNYTIREVNAMAEFDQGDYFYVFHLYYDHGQLVVNRDVNPSYNIIRGDFTPEKILTPRPYRGKIISTSGKNVAQFEFDPQNGSPNFVKGVVDVQAPFSASAKVVNFYANDGQLLLEVNVSGTSVCNENNVCEQGNGEDAKNCPLDCKATVAPTPTASPTDSPIPSLSVLISPTQNPTLTTQSNSKLVLVLIAGGLLGVAAVVFVIIKMRKQKVESTPQ